MRKHRKLPSLLDFKTIKIKEEKFKAHGFDYIMKLNSFGVNGSTPVYYEVVFIKSVGADFPMMINIRTSREELATSRYNELKTAALNNEE